MCKDIPPIDLNTFGRKVYTSTPNIAYVVFTSDKEYYLVGTMYEAMELMPKQISDTITQKDTN